MTRSTSQRRRPRRRHHPLRKIDGRHPLKRAAPDCYVGYRARRRHDSEVAYFNFGLAREMGLIPSRHPDRLTADLRRAILETFSLVIINEYDFLNGTPIPRRDLLPHGYMATRYLQLQHPDKRGANSGDGRSVWNGCVTRGGVTWDVSSCGTGVTRLCPATSQHKTFFRTGNYIASYGCGTAALAEGINAALMSEIFHRNGIATERVLAVLALPSGLAINVRAARNLLRPSHFLVHLRADNREPLRQAVDFFIDRQVANGDWPALPAGRDRRGARRRYGYLAEDAARTFARATATFESEYIFCWLDWDGDNILADGSIVDYGSIRQFGLYHREYRFEDTNRMSTTIPEQRRKARHLVQKYAQIRDFLVSGKKTPLTSFARDPILALFDAEFERIKRLRLLHKIGFDEPTANGLLEKAGDELLLFSRAFTSFERARSSRGPVKVPDGLSWNAIYCMRDVLRELPVRCGELLTRAAEQGKSEPADALLCLPADELIEIALSSYASRSDRTPSRHRRRMARELQRGYVALLRAAAELRGEPLERTLHHAAQRAAVINQRDRITGDGIDHAASRLIRRRRQLSVEALYHVVQRFTDSQDLDPARAVNCSTRAKPAPAPLEERVLASLTRATRDFREGL